MGTCLSIGMLAAGWNPVMHVLEPRPYFKELTKLSFHQSSGSLSQVTLPPLLSNPSVLISAMATQSPHSYLVCDGPNAAGWCACCGISAIRLVQA